RRRRQWRRRSHAPTTPRARAGRRTGERGRSRPYHDLPGPVVMAVEVLARADGGEPGQRAAAQEHQRPAALDLERGAGAPGPNEQNGAVGQDARALVGRAPRRIGELPAVWEQLPDRPMFVADAAWNGVLAGCRNEDVP